MGGHGEEVLHLLPLHGKVKADVNSTVNYIAEKPSGSFCFAAADMNNNGIINVSDVNAIVNVLAEVKMPASAKKNFLATANEVTTNDKMYCSNITVAPGETATLPQEASVFRKMTVEDNIRSVLELTDFSKEYQAEKLEQLIKEFNLAHVRKNLGDRLSGGERRRTEIARCLAIEPKFVMLDEPFAGVDPIAVQEIQDVVWQLKDKNIGILITDHNVDETLMITDRAYLLFEGKILFHGTPEELAANPIVRQNYLGRDFELLFGKKE